MITNKNHRVCGRISELHQVWHIRSEQHTQAATVQGEIPLWYGQVKILSLHYAHCRLHCPNGMHYDLVGEGEQRVPHQHRRTFDVPLVV